MSSPLLMLLCGGSPGAPPGVVGDMMNTGTIVTNGTCAPRLLLQVQLICSYIVNMSFIMLLSGDIELNPGPTEDIDCSIRRSTIDSSGTCTKCKKDAGADFMKCFGCEELFHVINCSVEKQVTSTIMNGWPNMTTKYSNIQYICDACKHDKQMRKDIIVSNRMCLMEEQLRSITTMMKETKEKETDIAQLVTSNTNMNVELDKLRSTVNTLVEKTVAGSNSVTASKTYADIARGEKSILVIKKNNNGESAKMEEVQQVAVDTGSAVTTAYTNPTGDTVVVCENHRAQEKMKPALEHTMSDFTVVAPKARKPTINIAGITADHGKEDLFKIIQNQNRERGITVTDDNFQILFTKKHAKNDKLFMAVARVSDDIRDAVKGAGNRVCVGSVACRVYDRFFVRRCNICQQFGHWKEDCTATRPTCGRCSEAHETSDCTSTVLKCKNCADAGFSKTNHETSWHKCASYISAQDKFKSTVNYYNKSN